MNVLIIGAGAVGLGIGASLYDVGWKLDIVDRKETREAIEEKGIVRRGLFREIIIPAGRVNVFEKLENIQGDIQAGNMYDYVLICTKTTISSQIAEDLAKHKNILKEEGKIVIFQNGYGTDETFLKYFTKDQIYSARIITAFCRPELNISEVKGHAAPILIGSLYGRSSEYVKPLAQAISDGGIPSEITDDIQKALWAKMLYNCTLNPLGAILDVKYGKLTENKYSLYIMDKVIDEIFEVMTAAGYRTYWEDTESYKKEFYSELIPSTCDHRSSTLQDIERKIKTEIETLTNVIVKMGRTMNIPVPFNDMTYNLIKTMESYY
ncbi:MAG: ketopantoate reductase family protein [Desulfitobacteriaceae bacterium]|nr:ketopantoate reductase family protein [Desulfitobacteriaceae bacterium]MDD4346207.1 ketopantoate reductase family protein [Desulfitobacteriaceae bacterium]MDD4400857.1 ketopantoate reductase family protein [Desulfitobacteriaceae bacterium]